MQLIAKGAEAELIKENGSLLKNRISKGYRLPVLDERLRKKRTRLEARLLREARRSGVLTPIIEEQGEFSIKMKFIDGRKVKDALNEENCEEICEKIGEAIAKLHLYDIIHGDLTTSNMIVTIGKHQGGSDTDSEEGHGTFQLYFIDFGLGFMSKRDEDKATDLYLFHEALESTHFDLLEKTWKTVLDTYKQHYPGAEEVIKALLKVEKRGRYKERSK